MAKNEKTSGKVATKASGVLRSSSASMAAKSVAGSALAQAGTNKSTSAPVASKAARILYSDTSSKTNRTVAASVLTQKPNKGKSK